MALDQRQKAMLDFAVEVAQDATGVDQARVDVLIKEFGFSDEDVLNIVQVVGFFSYYNRMVQALGVKLEDEWTDDAS